MKTIWRYKFSITDEFTLDMPSGSRVLAAFLKANGEPSLWAEVDTNMLLETRKFAVVGTGNPMPQGLKKYISSFESHGGQFVWHLYERR